MSDVTIVSRLHGGTSSERCDDRECVTSAGSQGERCDDSVTLAGLSEVVA